MAFESYSTFNQTGIEGLLRFANHTVPAFTPILLSVFYLIILLAIIFNTERKGKVDYPAAFAVAGWVSLMLAIALDMLTGVVNTPTMVWSAVMAIIGMAFLLFGKERGV